MQLSRDTRHRPSPMSEPRNVHEELATHLRADEATVATSALSNLPRELILHIASLLDIGDLLTLMEVWSKLRET